MYALFPSSSRRVVLPRFYIEGGGGGWRHGGCVVLDCIILLKTPNAKKCLVLFPTAIMSDFVPFLSLGGG